MKRFLDTLVKNKILDKHFFPFTFNLFKNYFFYGTLLKYKCEISFYYKTPSIKIESFNLQYVLSINYNCII